MTTETIKQGIMLFGCKLQVSEDRHTYTFTDSQQQTLEISIPQRPPFTAAEIEARFFFILHWETLLREAEDNQQETA